MKIDFSIRRARIGGQKLTALAKALLAIFSSWERDIFYKNVASGKLAALQQQARIQQYMGNENCWVIVFKKKQSWVGRKVRVNLGRIGGEYDQNIHKILKKTNKNKINKNFNNNNNKYLGGNARLWFFNPFKVSEFHYKAGHSLEGISGVEGSRLPSHDMLMVWKKVDKELVRGFLFLERKKPLLGM